jgi:quercetin dioxygenase-like cupin family protein
MANDVLRLENRHTGEILRLRRVRDAAGQVALAIEGSLPPKSSGPPVHMHLREREDVRVVTGTLGARVGKEKITAVAGGSAVFPAGVAHTWWNAGEDLLELSGKVTPAVDLDRYLQGMFAVLNASASGRPPLFYLAHVLWRHRHTQATMAPPPAIQRIVLPVILLLGRLLGKYRGTAWPGAPEMCAGAPEARAAGA